MVAPGERFVAENHVNVVRPRPGGTGAAVPLDRVLEGLRSERAGRAIRLLTGNTQISATELRHLVPVLPRV